MILQFGNRLISHSKNCKVTKVVENYFSKDVQNINSNGSVFASLFVPTIRELNVELLIIASSPAEITKKVDQVREYLDIESVQKLYLRNGKERYYKASCTKIANPVHKGSSCRLNITFTCEDLREYSSATDLPIGSSYARVHNFTFNGKHCLNDLGCIFVEDETTAIPNALLNKYKISGVDGTLRFDKSLVNLDERHIKGNLYLVQSKGEKDKIMEQSEIEERLHKIASFFLSSRRSEFISDKDITRACLAELDSEVFVEYEKWANGLLKISFVCQPVLYDTTPAETSANLNISSSAFSPVDISSLFPRSIGWETPFILSLKNNGTQTIREILISHHDFDGNEKLCIIKHSEFSLASGQTLVISSEDFSIKLGSLNMLKALASGTLPFLYPGSQSLNIKTDVSANLEVMISARGRWV